ncbi:acyl-CoA dehydratase activase-related protein [Heliomicrobium gestii]|nr:acyl-CoA dehydratase activase-related protein [Heliomicrobium gestii]MBM7865165.1 putative nucleotide-binding protein (sugar kinase/HSP70/actin superfamily) [Heliomicrobium gestii]
MKITSVLTMGPPRAEMEGPPVIGIPRALGYYEYLPLWRAFFEALGCAVILSPPTNKALLDQGVRAAVDEACLPVKMYYGHVKALAGKADHVFAPRMISVQPKTYLCPKFLGLPDMIRGAAAFDGGYPPLLIVDVNTRHPGGGWEKALTEAAGKLNFSRARAREALKVARKAQDEFESRLLQGEHPPTALARWEKTGRVLEPGGLLPRLPARHREPLTGEEPRIAVAGHPYQLFDPFTSMNLLHKLKSRGIRVVTPMAVTEEKTRQATCHLPKRLFWSFGQKMLGGSLHLLKGPIDGLIYVAAFGCGPDSLVGEMVERHARRLGNVPYLLLTVDEHTGEAGVVTRLEAFIDLVARRRETAEAATAAEG